MGDVTQECKEEDYIRLLARRELDKIQQERGLLQRDRDLLLDELRQFTAARRDANDRLARIEQKVDELTVIFNTPFEPLKAIKAWWCER